MNKNILKIIFAGTVVFAGFVFLAAPSVQSALLESDSKTHNFNLPEGATEIVEMRTEKTKTFALPTGQRSIVSRGVPLHYQSKDGTWKDIDLHFVETGSGYELTTAPSPIFVTDRGVAIFEGGTSNGIRWLTFQKPKVIDDSVVFRSHNLSWRWVPQATGLKLFSEEIETRQGYREYIFPFELIGEKNELKIDNRGNIHYGNILIPRPFILGADRETYSCSWRINGNNLVLVCDDSSLPTEALPYVIDPSTSPESAGYQDELNFTSCTISGWSTGASNDRALFSDDVRASIEITSGVGCSEWLYIRNWGFSGIPASSIIDNISFDVERQYGGSGGGLIYDNFVTLYDATNFGSNRATTTVWPASEATISYNFTKSQWVGTSSLSLTTSTVIGTNFGVLISVKGDLAATKSAQVDAVDNMVITYSPPPSVTSIAGANPQTTAGGYSITINGADFVSGATVTVGTSSATGVSFVNSTQLTATAPARPAGSYAVTVTNPNGGVSTSTSQTVTYIAPPSGVTVSQQYAPVPTGFTGRTFNGTGISTATVPLLIGGSNAFYFGGTSSSVTVFIPADQTAGAKSVRVFGASGSSTNGIFLDLATGTVTYVNKPSSLSLSQSYAPASTTGVTSTISGVDLGTSVTFPIKVENTTTTANSTTTTTVINFTLPSNSTGTKTITVYGANGSDSNAVYSTTSIIFVAKPSSLSLDDAYIKANTSGTRTISGSDIGVALSCPVKLNGTCIPSGFTTTTTSVTFTATSSLSAGAYTLRVYGANGSDANSIYTDTTLTYTNAPTDVAIDNSQLSGNTAGQTRTFTGTGLSTSTNPIRVGTSTYGTYSSGPSSSIVVTMPQMAPGLYDVRVYGRGGTDANGVYTDKTGFVVYSPKVDSVSPATVATVGGETVTVYGQGLKIGAGGVLITLPNGSTSSLTTTGDANTSASFTTPASSNGGAATLRVYGAGGSDANGIYIETSSLTYVAPVYTQSGYRWFQNANSATPGSAKAATNVSTTFDTAGEEVRLRMLVDLSIIQSPVGDGFKLQVASTTSACSAGLSYADVSAASGAIRFNNNAGVADGSALSTTSTDPTHSSHANVAQTYQESNTFYTTTTIATGTDALWDFSLYNYAAQRGTSYCFRLVKSDGTVLDTYSVYPMISVANLAPQVQSVTAAQNASGTVDISYETRDPDTGAEAATPSLITPSFAYWDGSSWTNITSSSLGATDLNTKSVNSSTYTAHTATWSPTTQIPGAYGTSYQIRALVNDSEATNNTASSTSATLTVDARKPTSTTFLFDSRNDLISLVGSDNSNLSYTLSNNSDFSSDGLNASSGVLVSVGATSVSSSLSWNATGTPSYERIYVRLQDAVNNITTSSVVVPAMPQDFVLADDSNPNAGFYAESLSWTTHTDTTGATAQFYEVWRALNSTSSFLLRATTTNNYYNDIGLSGTSTYYYKIAVKSSEGNYSNYSTSTSDRPDGLGTSANAAPSFDTSFDSVHQTGATILQVATSTDSDWGKVKISYRLRDTDTTTATTTPSFEYNIGSGWVSITTGYLASGDLNDKAVSSSSFTTYTATWHASSQLASTYSTNLQVRVTATDGQGSGQAVTSPITLDTTLPSVASTTLLINGASSAAEATSSAALSLQLQSISGTPSGETIYARFSNDSSTWYGANSDGTLTTSTTSWGTGFSSATSTLSALTWPWSLGGSTLYVQIRDNYGNGPATDSNTVTGYNQAPQFESLTVSQASSSNPLAGGLVTINYSIRDTDTTSVTPSFAYSLNSGNWTTISSAAMNSTSTDAKSVASSSYTAYVATWSATTTVTSTYSTDLRVRVTLNDGQVVNNTASSSATITLDSRGPVASTTTLLVNGSSTSVSAVSSTITLGLQNITGYPDSETIYAQFSDDDSTWYGANSNGTLASSSSWGSGFSSASSTLSSLSWSFAISGRSRTIYTRLTDAFGNNLQSDSNSVGYNVPPEFNPSYGTNGLSVSQNTSSLDSSWGKVSIQYNVRDTDTSVGSSTPGYITPSFEYNVGSGWFPITTSTLVAGDTSNKAVNDSSYTTHSATWHASSQLASTYSTNLQVRVTANDNEPVSNTTSATSSATTLDTKAPATTVRVDARNNRVSVIATDDTSVDYTLSNLASLASDGSNASSGVWTATNATSTNTSSSWTLITSSSLNTVYYATRDLYGNTVSGSASAPIAPASTSVTDVSDTSNLSYKELISWTVYTSTSSAPFSKYEVYRATGADPSTFSLIGTVTDIAQNYYTDTSLSSSTTYYYKVSIVTTNNDYSAYSPTVSDQPDGLSGAAAQGPTISNVTAAEVQASWARITWDTDRVSDSKVEYSIATSSSPYGLSTTTVTLVTSHDVYIGDLLPNTEYSYRVTSKDVNNKQTTSAGGTFTTSGGPIISAVTTEAVTDHTASIIWNTNKDANSTVLYSTSLQNLRDGTSTSQAGNAGLVGSPYQHRVTLSGLNTQTIYYYYVKSTDASSNVSADKNGGNYYTFSTAQDTKSPTISNITVAAVTKNSAVITWQTDEPSNSQLTYDTRSASSSGQAHRNTSLLDDNQTTNHAITLTGLSANTTYYYYVKSIDAAGNQALSSEQSVQTSDTETVIIYATGGGSAAPPANSIIKDTTPPVISNVEVSAITPFSAKVTFDTDEESLGLVSFGEDTNYGRTPGEASFRTKHEINLVGLKLGTTYHFQVKASDKGGNFTAGLDDTFTTKFAVESVGEIANLENVEQYQSEIDTLIESVTPSLVTPFIGKIEVTELTENSVIIKWTTNTRTYGSVLYVADKDYDEKKENPYLAEVSDTQPRTTTHQVQLNNLSPGQLYRFKIKSYTLPNVVGWSTERTFTTKSSRIRPDIVRLFNTSFVVTWQTPKQTTSFVEYQNTKTKQIRQSGNDTLVTAHVVNVENLDPDTTYRVRAFGYDTNKNIVESETITVTTKKDIVPPTISNLKIDNTFVPGRNDRIQTVISWKTDEPASSLVFYGEGSVASQKQLPNSASSTDAALNTNHNVIITNFKPGTIYQMQVVSVDGAGNRAASPIRVIITPKQTQSVFDVIVKNFEGTFKFINQ